MARFLQIVGFLLLIVPLGGNTSSRRLNGSELPADLKPAYDSLYSLWGRREYVQLLKDSQALSSTAARRGLLRTQARIESITAGALSLTFQYRASAQTYLRVIALAERTQDWPLTALASFNLSNVYFHLGALDESAAALHRASLLVPAGASLVSPVDIALHRARLAASTEGIATARPLLRQALSLAESLGDHARAALVQETAAAVLLQAGFVEDAASAAETAHAYRRQSNDPLLSSTLLTLSRIRNAQSRPREALALAQQAFLQLNRNPPQRPLYRFYQFRGEALAALGRLEDARKDLRAAIEHLRLLRPESLPAESILLRSFSEQQDVFASLAGICARLYLRSGHPSSLWESFAAANDNRAFAMRLSLARRDDPTAAYANLVSQLQAAELSALRDNSAGARAALASARLNLAESELAARAGLRLPSPTLDLRLLQSKLPPRTAIVQFQVGPQASYAWVLTPRSLSLAALPPAATLERATSRLLPLLAQNASAALPASQRLYTSLFGPLLPSLREATHWIILPDQFLYRIPFAALVTGFSQGAPRFLVQDTSLQIAPFLATPASAPVPVRRAGLIAFGDPIYNAADPRFQPPPVSTWLPWAFFHPSPEAISLPRLPGTASEIRLAARAWNGNSRLFSGAHVNAANLSGALSLGPEVLHLATHLVPSAADPAESRLMLSLTPSGVADLLDPAGISHLPVSCPLIVMSGCRAGAADAIASEGLLGLSRAWLSAGASSVLATRWAMPDDTGAMWEPFYKAWRASSLPPGAARASAALQSAQQELIASGSWRSRPSFWASYFVIGSH